MTTENISSAMPLPRAIAINDAIVAVYMWTTGVVDVDPDLSNLAGVDLADMLTAKAIVQAANTAAAASTAGGYSIAVVPDDLLIAATYTLMNAKAGLKPIAVASGKAVGVLPLREGGRKKGSG